LRPLGMRAAAFIVADPPLSTHFRDRFVLTDSIGRTAGRLPGPHRTARQPWDHTGAAPRRVRRPRPRRRQTPGTLPGTPV
jgi:hypothetical protein